MTEKNTGYETVENIGGNAEGMESAYVEFPPDVLEKLNADLEPDLISEREGAGKRILKYIEAYVAIEQANRIFGHGAWGPRVLEGPTLHSIPETNPATGEIVDSHDYYTARVGIWVYGHMRSSDEGFCEVRSLKEGTIRSAIVGMHEMARKGAISDGIKRALRTFGKQFGNDLYGDESDTAAHDPNAPTCPRHGPGRHIRESNRGDGYYCSRKDDTDTGYCVQTPYVPTEVPLTKETASYAASAPSGMQRNGGAASTQPAHASKDDAGNSPHTASATNGSGPGAVSRNEALEEYIAIGVECGLNKGQIFTNYLQKHGKPISQASTDELALLVQQARQIEREQS